MLQARRRSSLGNEPRTNAALLAHVPKPGRQRYQESMQRKLMQTGDAPPAAAAVARGGVAAARSKSVSPPQPPVAPRPVSVLSFAGTASAALPAAALPDHPSAAVAPTASGGATGGPFPSAAVPFSATPSTPAPLSRIALPEGGVAQVEAPLSVTSASLTSPLQWRDLSSASSGCGTPFDADAVLVTPTAAAAAVTPGTAPAQPSAPAAVQIAAVHAQPPAQHLSGADSLPFSPAAPDWDVVQHRNL